MDDLAHAKENEKENLRKEAFDNLKKQNVLLKEQIDNQNLLIEQREKELKQSQKINIIMIIIAILSLVVAIVFGILSL